MSISNIGGPTAIGTTLSPETCNNADGAINITGVTAGASPYTYSFDNGTTYSGTTTKTSLAPGNYPVAVKDNNGCVFNTTVTITKNGTVPTVTISGNNTICQNQSTTLTANGGTSWLWSTGARSQSITVNPSTSTTYDVIGSNGACAAAKKQVTVTVNPNPTAAISGTNTICNGKSTTLTATGGTSYAWNTTPVQTTAGITVSPSTNTSYTVTVTDAKNCTDTETQLVTVNAQLAAPSTAAVGYCHNEPSTALTAAGSNLLWYTAATGGVGSTTAPTPSTATVGSTDYYVSQTVNGCQSPRAVLTVTIGDLPAAPTVSTPLMYCQNEPPTAITATGSNLLWYTSATGGTGNTTAPTPVTTSIGSTTYYVSQTVNGCESARENITVTVKSLPVIITSPSNTFGGPDTTICVNKATALRASGADSYVWTPASLLQTTTGTQVQTVPLAMGQYTFTVTGTKDGCASSKDIDVLVLDEIPPPTVAGNQNICKGEGVTLVATTSINPAQFFWYKDSTLQQVIINQATLQTGPLFTNDTTFYTNILYGNCASGLTYFSIEIKSLPQIVITGNTPICSGDKLNLTASGGKEYRWYTAPNDTISNKAVLDAIADENTTTYYVLVKDSACIAIDTVQVQVNPLPAVNAGTPVGICKEEQTQLGTPTQTGISYQWQPVTNLSNPTLAQPTFRAKQVGRTQYTLTATYTTTGCDQSDNLQVDVYELPTARIDLPADVLCNDKLINLTGNGGLNAQDNYEWLRDGQVFAYTNRAAITLAEVPAVYTLRITTVQGCEDTAMLYLKGENCDASDVYLPDMFTPNGDESNDVLQIVYKQGIVSADVSIFDRWGALVYTGTKESEPWNGTVNGQDLSEGLYVYIINLKTSKKSFNKIGTIAIGR